MLEGRICGCGYDNDARGKVILAKYILEQRQESSESGLVHDS